LTVQRADVYRHAALKFPRSDNDQSIAAHRPIARAARDRAACRLQSSMAVRVGFSATISRKPRQARKGAAVAVQSGAEEVLTRAATSSGSSA
jgi:GTP cyclohydrolase III